MSIDWKFISSKDIEGESEHLTGYVPQAGKSGFTVGSWDIGQHSQEDVRRILQSYSNKLAGGGSAVGAIRQDLLDELSPYALRKDISDAEARNISFTKEDIQYLMAAKRHEFETKTLSNLKGWEGLTPEVKTILASVGWQYGTSEKPFQDLYALRDDPAQIVSKLIEMGEKSIYTHRRKEEAKYLNTKIGKRQLMPDDAVWNDMGIDEIEGNV